MKTPILVLLALSAGCVSISDSELAERQAGYAFAVEVTSATPVEAFACADPGLTVGLAIDPSMAGVSLEPTVSLGGTSVALDPFVVPADGVVSLDYGEPLPCAEGLCELTVDLTLATAEGASASASTTVRRLADPAPVLGRQGVASVDDLLVEGLELQSTLDGGEGALDIAEFPVGFVVASDPVFAEVAPADLGRFQVHACPLGSNPGSPDCLTTNVLAGGLPLPGIADDAVVLAFETADFAPFMCDDEVAWQLHIGFTSDVCDGPEQTAAILPALRFQGDCDADGFTPAEGDCDDGDPAIYAGVVERCNGIDDDCDEVVGASELDEDGDGYVECSGWEGSDPLVVDGDDCAPADRYVFPGAPEVCNFADDDCDGVDDNGITYASLYADADGDGLGAGDLVEVCPDEPGYVDNDADCDDGDASAAQASVVRFCSDRDGDGHGSMRLEDELLACPGTAVAGYLEGPVCDDCNDDVSGELAERLCVDGDDDGLGDFYDPLPIFACYDGPYDPEPYAGFAVCEDCDDLDPRVGAVELWPDADNDGFGNASAPFAVCEAPLMPEHWVENADDCDDGDAGTGARYEDGDGDGFAAIGATSDCGLAVWADVATDCDDTDYDFKPGWWRRRESADEPVTWSGDTYLANAIAQSDGGGLIEICGEIVGTDFGGALAVVDDASNVTSIVGTPGYATLVGPAGDRSIGIQSAIGRSVQLRGFTITGEGTGDGGGILHVSGQLELVDMTIEGCRKVDSTGTGGGVVSGGSLYVQDTVIRDNEAELGGGIYSTGGTITFANVVRIEGNDAVSGGGIYLAGAAGGVAGVQELEGSPLLTLNDAEIGGGLFVADAAALTGGMRFSNNTALMRGGQLFVDTGAALTVDGGTWVGGEADLGGGAFIAQGAFVDLSGIAVSNQLARIEGGALFTEGTVAVSDVSFEGNEAEGTPPKGAKGPGLIPLAGQDVAVVGESAFFQAVDGNSWESNEDGIVTRGFLGPGGKVVFLPVGFDPFDLGPSFACDQGGCN